MDLNPWVGSGAVVGVIAVTLAFILNVARYIGRRQRDLEAAQALDRARGERCEHRLNYLINLLNKSGVVIPAEFWEL